MIKEVARDWRCIITVRAVATNIFHTTARKAFFRAALFLLKAFKARGGVTSLLILKRRVKKPSKTKTPPSRSLY